MKKTEEALSTFNNGFNCAQAVLSVFAPEMGLDRSVALKIATGMGAGLGHQGSICGAVFGAYLAISLKYGSNTPFDETSKDMTYYYTRQFDRQFLKLHDSLICSNLLGADMSTPEGINTAVEQGLFDDKCQRYVKDAVVILEKMLEKS